MEESFPIFINHEKFWFEYRFLLLSQYGFNINIIISYKLSYHKSIIKNNRGCTFVAYFKKNNMMELGIGMFGDLQIDSQTGKIQAPQQRLQEIIEEIKLMDEVGVDFFGMGEHHRADYAVASPEIILAAAATVTKRIKLGSARFCNSRFTFRWKG